jgi:hypothetical protein
MADRQIEKAQEIAREHGAHIAETAGLADDLRRLREELSKPGANKAMAAASSPQVQKAFDLMAAQAEPVWPGPSRVVLPETSRIDHSGMAKLMTEAEEGLQARHAEKRDREQRMIQTLEGVRAELIASGEREAKNLKRAEKAEGYNATMLKLAVAGLVVAIITLYVALSAPAS